jgi:hypothetical protein
LQRTFAAIMKCNALSLHFPTTVAECEVLAAEFGDISFERASSIARCHSLQSPLFSFQFQNPQLCRLLIRRRHILHAHVIGSHLEDLAQAVIERTLRLLHVVLLLDSLT